MLRANIKVVMRMSLLGLLLSGLLAAACSTTAPVQVLSVAPTDNAGVSNTLLSAIDLADEVHLSGYQLRARAVTIAPGGHTAAHTHVGRPTQEYIAQGTVIEVRNGTPIEHHAGDIAQGVNGVHHWWENHGSVPVVLIPVDIAKP
ncbi:hypothetical protein RA280_24940 [Cupriavidus sp. CV2]|uniref:hypothetical protein n=1 Tax=Cupriavidus ulmosensis TaxID=3065913 RepID=UPI00296A94C3|nr:hypothetical protein [Cupriavidus sp. CV2]MDW3684940.1 hypothetical protein [Cupriavidus sp. CV2]